MRTGKISRRTFCTRGHFCKNKFLHEGSISHGTKKKLKIVDKIPAKGRIRVTVKLRNKRNRPKVGVTVKSDINKNI